MVQHSRLWPTFLVDMLFNSIDHARKSKLINLIDMLVRAEVKRPQTKTVSTKEKMEKLQQVPVDFTVKRQTSLTNFFWKGGEESQPSVRSSRLVSAIETEQKKITFVSPCVERNKCRFKTCRYCPLIDTSGEVQSTVTGQRFWCMKSMTCCSSNLIYCITCATCSQQYVGQTKRTVMAYLRGHFDKIQREITEDAVGGHFSSKDHRGTRDLRIQVLEFIKSPPESAYSLQVRLQKEKTWIHRLRTPAPTGLNIFDWVLFSDYNEKFI